MDSHTRLETLTRLLRRHLDVVTEGFLLSDSFLIDLEHPLGAGGQGAVYPGVHAQLELPVAVKVFGAEDLDDSKMVARFVQEARILAGLNSPDLVRVWDLKSIPEIGCYYFVTEFVEGAPLQDAYASARRQLTEAEAVAATIACARGLAAMHQVGIIHRDFKPGNALWVAGTERVKVCDLGLAKESSGGTMDLTVMGETFGSPAYMAPEQARGASQATPRSDVYSLGAILYFLLIGEAPATMTSLQDLLKGDSQEEKLAQALENRGVSLRTNGLITQMLSKKPEERPRDASEALVLLESLLGDLPGADRVSLAKAFAKASIHRPMQVRLAKEPGTLWMPPRRQRDNPEPFGDTVRFDKPANLKAPKKEGVSLETQFWESAFPILKKEREKGEDSSRTSGL